MSALFMPVLAFLFGLAFPLGWLLTPRYDSILSIVQNPMSRLIVFSVCSLSLFHWAHRFRFTLYDGLQIKHLNEVITVCCYGGAIVGTVLAAVLLWQFP